MTAALDSRSPLPAVRKGRGPSAAKTAATREALAAAGLAAFLENGFAGTRMSDVAERAGVAKGTAYLHFEDKAALFADVLRRFVRDAAAGRTLGRPRAEETTLAFLRRSILPMVQDIQANDRFRVLYLVIAEGARFPELADVYRTVAINPVIRLVRMYARRAERRGEIASNAVTRFPALLIAPVVTGAIWNNLFGRDEPLDVAAMLDDHLRLLFSEPASASEMGRPGRARS